MTDFSVVEEASGVEPNVDNKTISRENLKLIKTEKVLRENIIRKFLQQKVNCKMP